MFIIFRPGRSWNRKYFFSVRPCELSEFFPPPPNNSYNLTLYEKRLHTANGTSVMKVDAVPKYWFPIVSEIVILDNIRRGSDWVLKICAPVVCYDLGIHLSITGPQGFFFLDCVLGRPCYGIFFSH